MKQYKLQFEQKFRCEIALEESHWVCRAIYDKVKLYLYQNISGAYRWRRDFYYYVNENDAHRAMTEAETADEVGALNLVIYQSIVGYIYLKQYVIGRWWYLCADNEWHQEPVANAMEFKEWHQEPVANAMEFKSKTDALERAMKHVEKVDESIAAYRRSISP